jgi:hypothetical protein
MSKNQNSTARADGRLRMTATLLFMGPTLAAAVLLSAAPAAMVSSQIELSSTSRELLPMAPSDQRAGEPIPAPSVDDSAAGKKKPKFDEYNYYQCIQNGNNDPQSCCLISDGVWTPYTNDPYNPTGTCRAQRIRDDALPGGLPTEAADTGAPLTPQSPLTGAIATR